MYREVDRTQAIEAAFDRRPAFMITEESGSLRFYDLSEELYDVVNHLHEPRFIVDMPDDADIEGKKAEENTPPPDVGTKKPGKPGRKKISIDTGKVMALHNAGWSQKAIADELGVSQTTIAKCIIEQLGNED